MPLHNFTLLPNFTLYNNSLYSTHGKSSSNSEATLIAVGASVPKGAPSYCCCRTAGPGKHKPSSPTKLRASGMKSFGFLIGLILISTAGVAQNVPGTVRGQVTDPTGAVIPGATIMVKATGGNVESAQTTDQGSYELKGLTPGTYSVTATAPGFASSQPQNISVTAGQTQQFNIKLEIQVEQ